MTPAEIKAKLVPCKYCKQPASYSALGMSAMCVNLHCVIKLVIICDYPEVLIETWNYANTNRPNGQKD